MWFYFKKEKQGGNKMTVYKFTSIDRTLEFIIPLLIEGKHSVSVRTFFKEYPVENQLRETMIDYFEVTVEEIEKCQSQKKH